MINKINNFVNEVLKNDSGKLNGQRLSEKWLKPRYPEMLKIFKELNLLNPKNLYCFLHNEGEQCSKIECFNVRRFVGFKHGFKQYCEKCSRTLNNPMKSQGTKDVELNNVIEFVKINGKYTTSKIKQLSAKTINEIKRRTNYLNDVKISERLYNIEHNITSYTKCKACNKNNKNFKTGKRGYFQYCRECSYNITENAIKRKLGLRKRAYAEYTQTYAEVLNTDEYMIELFSLRDYLNDRTTCTVKFKHFKCNHVYTRNIDYQGHLKCPKCYPTRSRKQYNLFCELVEFDSELLFNDRKHIKPKEIDILSHKFKFGIEYDSLNYHSFGYHTKKELNIPFISPQAKNYHVNKTNAVEETGYQLFRVFSNEWSTKKEIWKSMLMNKTQQSKKLHARKCKIKLVDNKLCNQFLELNHLQGKSVASVRLGLYHNNELTSVMTFCKSRYNKSHQYELIRFCTLLNTTVVGGASKLLKYFERQYTPTSIISYANRRWSNGNLYEKLGFEFSHCTEPNYFYFKGDDNAKLLSRVRFQKHKLKDKLKVFNLELTETQNMFNNGYRKIYDCGNLVYTKKYK